MKTGDPGTSDLSRKVLQTFGPERFHAGHSDYQPKQCIVIKGNPSKWPQICIVWFPPKLGTKQKRRREIWQDEFAENAKMLYLYKVLFQFLFVLRHANPFATTTWQFQWVPRFHSYCWMVQKSGYNSPVEVGIRSSGPLFTGIFLHHPTGGCYLGFLNHQWCMNLCLFFPWFPLVFHSKNRFITFSKAQQFKPSQGWKKL